MKSEKSYSRLYFLIAVLIIYGIAVLLKPEILKPSFEFFSNIIISIIPIFILIFVLMALTNYFVDPQTLVKYIGQQAGAKSWLIAVVTGIISTGPIYMWYPLLADLKKNGARTGFLATFLYNRAIKLPLLPMIIFYFGWIYTAVLTIVMVLFSVIQGMIIERLVR